MTILKPLYLIMFPPVHVYLYGRHNAPYDCTVYVVCVVLPISLDSAQISDSHFLRAVCVQPTVDEGEFGRAINSPLVVFHSAEGRAMSRGRFDTGPKHGDTHGQTDLANNFQCLFQFEKGIIYFNIH